MLNGDLFIILHETSYQAKTGDLLLLFFTSRSYYSIKNLNEESTFFNAEIKAEIYVCAYLSTYECFSSLVLWYFKIKEYIKTETEGLEF